MQKRRRDKTVVPSLPHLAGKPGLPSTGIRGRSIVDDLQKERPVAMPAFYWYFAIGLEIQPQPLHQLRNIV